MFFLDNPALYDTTSYGFLTPYQNLEKANDKIPRKPPDRRTHGQTEWRRDPITLPATPVGPNSRLTRLMFKVNSKSNRMISVDVDLVSTFLTLNKFCTVTHSRLMFHFYILENVRFLGSIEILDWPEMGLTIFLILNMLLVAAISCGNSSDIQVSID